MWLSNFLLEVNTQAFNMVSLYKELYRTEKTRGRSYPAFSVTKHLKLFLLPLGQDALIHFRT